MNTKAMKLKATDLVKGEWYQVQTRRGWGISKFWGINSVSCDGRHLAVFQGSFASQDVIPRCFLPLRGLQVRPVTEETKTKLNELLANIETTKAAFDAAKQELEDWTAV